MEFTSDNAAMIARAAIEMYNKKLFTNYKNLKVLPRVEFKKCKE